MQSLSFTQYIKSLRPTGSGLLALSLCLIIIPLFADIVLLFFQRPGKNSIRLSSPLLNAYIKALPLYISYLLLYFLLLTGWNYIIKKTNIETLHFGS